MLDLDPIKATLSAATPGPWGPAHVLDQGMIAGWPDRLVEIGRYEVRMTGGRSRVDADAHLIASAPAMIADLAAEVEALRALLSRAWDDLPEGCTVLRGEILQAQGYRGCTWCGMICVDHEAEVAGVEAAMAARAGS